MIITQKEEHTTLWREDDRVLINQWANFAEEADFLNSMGFANGFINDHHLVGYISDRTKQELPLYGSANWYATNLIDELRLIKAPLFALVVPKNDFFTHLEPILNYLLNNSGKPMQFRVFKSVGAAEVWIEEKAIELRETTGA